MTTSCFNPCPFCGGTFIYSHTYNESFGKKILETKMWGVMCDKCNCCINDFRDEASAIAAWNTRAPVWGLSIAELVSEIEGTCSRLTERSDAWRQLSSEASRLVEENKRLSEALKDVQNGALQALSDRCERLISECQELQAKNEALIAENTSLSVACDLPKDRRT